MVTRSPEVRHVVAWLPVVRWTTCVALWTMFAVVWFFPHLHLPLRAIVPLGLTAAICRTAVAFMLHARRTSPGPLVGLSLVADAGLLTGLLDVTGGPFNPFIVMYVTYVWLAAASSSPRWSVAVAATSALGVAWLVVDHLQAGSAEHHRLNDLPTHLFTMWLAAAEVTELVAHYVARSHAALAHRQGQLDDARDRAASSERLASLTTLAAGAAHELSTPLATIALAARELERSAARLSEPDEIVAGVKDDARLIRTEVDRCRMILDGMSGRASNATAAAPAALTPDAIARLAQERLTGEQRRWLRVEVAPGIAGAFVEGPEIVQAVSSLLKNAFDASDANSAVELRFARRGAMMRIEVQDGGTGMSPEARRRAGEPFYTTKEPGRGLGLGLFLARTFAERHGGTLQFEGEPGTTAILELPVHAAAEVSL